MAITERRKRIEHVHFRRAVVFRIFLQLRRSLAEVVFSKLSSRYMRLSIVLLLVALASVSYAQLATLRLLTAYQKSYGASCLDGSAPGTCALARQS